MTGDPVMCQCPPAWWGTVPPVCAVHNPSTFAGTQPVAHAVPLSDYDVERIARRVAELLKESK